MKKKIIQLLHTFNYGDAISNQVISIDRLLKEQGVDSRIVCLHAHPSYRHLVDQLQQLENADTVILHYSLGSPLNVHYLSLPSTVKRVLIYHNLTPSFYYQGVNPRVYHDLEAGRRELPKLCSAADLIMAISSFNAEELKKLPGLERRQISILPLAIDKNRWRSIPEKQARASAAAAGGIKILHVSRIAPNKAIEDLIKVIYFIHKGNDKNVCLWLVGSDIDNEIYSFALRRLVSELEIENQVRFFGAISDARLADLYTTADLYLCLSEHEGFCLPVIEAMKFSLPVVAYASSALSETVGDGGILLKDKDPEQVANLLVKVTKDHRLRGLLIAAGKKRAEELSYENFRSRFLELLFGNCSDSMY